MFLTLGLGAHRPWPYPCDRSHGYHHFQRSHNSLALRQVLSSSENNGTHKRALIDRKGIPRVYLDYCSTAFTPTLSLDRSLFFSGGTARSEEWPPCVILRSLTCVRDDSDIVRDDRDIVRDDRDIVRDDRDMVPDDGGMVRNRSGVA